MIIIGHNNVISFLSEMDKGYSKSNRISEFVYKGNKYRYKFDSGLNGEFKGFGKTFIPKFDGDILIIGTKETARAKTNRIYPIKINKNLKMDVFAIQLVDIKNLRIFGHLVLPIARRDVWSPFMFKNDEKYIFISDEEITDEYFEMIKKEVL